MPHNGGEVQAAERRLKAAELRVGGATYRQIGQTLGVSHTQARRDIWRALDASGRELAKRGKELRALEWERLELPVIQLANRIKQASSQSGALPTDELCALIREWVRLSESRRKLGGFDAPTEHRHGGSEDAPPIAFKDADRTIWEKATVEELLLLRELHERVATRASESGAGEPAPGREEPV